MLEPWNLLLCGFGDKSGIIAGGLSNEDEDKRIGDLDFALRKQEEIGNENGFASEPLKKNGGKSNFKLFKFCFIKS